MTALWGWFASTRVGRWLIGFTLVVAAFVAAWFVARGKGKAAQKATDMASAAQAVVAAANAAQDVQQSASAAVQQVDAQAVARPAPDVVKRDDFNNTGL